MITNPEHTDHARRAAARRLTDHDANGRRYAAPFRMRRRTIGIAVS